jgi:hypothetical protein
MTRQIGDRDKGEKEYPGAVDRRSFKSTSVYELLSSPCVCTRLLVLPLFLLPLLLQPTHSQSTEGIATIVTDDVVVESNSNSTGIFDCSACRVQDAVLFPWFVQLLGSCVLFLLTQYNIPFPFAAVMFILGAFMGAGVFYAGNDNALADSIKQWANIDSQLLFLIFLPGLIFKEAVEFNLNMFLVGLPQILILAFPMVLMGTVMTAVVCVTMLPYNWSVAAAATLGAILASTDPIAVASVLKTSGASPRLVMHIAGESLLNDGSAIVFFTLFSRIVYGEMGILPPGIEEITVANGVALFFQMSLGGTAMGVAFSLGLLAVLWQLDRRLEREFDVLQVVCGLATAYLCFYVCDQILTMSGVAACVTLGISVNAYGRGMINDEKLMGNYLTLVRTTLSVLFDLPDQRVPERLTPLAQKHLFHGWICHISVLCAPLAGRVLSEYTPFHLGGCHLGIHVIRRCPELPSTPLRFWLVVPALLNGNADSVHPSCFTLPYSLPYRIEIQLERGDLPVVRWSSRSCGGDAWFAVYEIHN